MKKDKVIFEASQIVGRQLPIDEQFTTFLADGRELLADIIRQAKEPLVIKPNEVLITGNTKDGGIYYPDEKEAIICFFFRDYTLNLTATTREKLEETALMLMIALHVGGFDVRCRTVWVERNRIFMDKVFAKRREIRDKDNMA